MTQWVQTEADGSLQNLCLRCVHGLFKLLHFALCHLCLGHLQAVLQALALGSLGERAAMNAGEARGIVVLPESGYALAWHHGIQDQSCFACCNCKPWFHCTGNVTQQAQACTQDLYTHACRDVASERQLPWQHRFVVKTVDEAGRKVFINVCGSAKVPAPGGWKPGQVKRTDLPSACTHTLSVWRPGCSDTALLRQYEATAFMHRLSRARGQGTGSAP